MSTTYSRHRTTEQLAEDNPHGTIDLTDAAFISQKFLKALVEATSETHTIRVTSNSPEANKLQRLTTDTSAAVELAG